MSKFCDFEDDCRDRSDEKRCFKIGTGCTTRNQKLIKEHGFKFWQCKSRYQCIEDHKRCDGHQDCRDGSDELPEQCQGDDHEGGCRQVTPTGPKS